MVLTMRKEYDRKYPMLVHCSAGIGRAGTVIALDQAIQLLMKKGSVNLLDIVAHIRTGRCALIQHKEQYKFFHAAVSRFTQLLQKPTDIV